MAAITPAGRSNKKARIERAFSNSMYERVT